MVYELLAHARDLDALNRAAAAAAAEIQDTVVRLLGQAEEGPGHTLALAGDAGDGDGARLVATARVLRGAAALAERSPGLTLPAVPLAGEAGGAG
jgi:hypothetical protein